MSDKLAKPEQGADLSVMSRPELESYVKHLEGLLAQKGDMKVMLTAFAQMMSTLSKNSTEQTKSMKKLADANQEMAAAVMAGRGRDMHGN